MINERIDGVDQEGNQLNENVNKQKIEEIGEKKTLN